MRKDFVEVGVKLYLNGFPKAGTHAVNNLAMHLLSRLSHDKNWIGSFQDNAFSTKWVEDDRVTDLIEVFPKGRFIKGHLGYKPEYAEVFKEHNFCKMIIARDLRDVAVSAAYHAKGDGTFPNKEFYQSLPYDEVLERVIVGDETIDGVVDRWELYAPWMDEEWVLKLAFEDLIENQAMVAGLFVRYLYGRTASYMDKDVVLDKEDYLALVNELVWQMKNPEGSPTYRKGKIGEWETHFTDRHKELFKKTDKNNWLKRLGYVEDRNW